MGRSRISITLTATLAVGIGVATLVQQMSRELRKDTGRDGTGASSIPDGTGSPTTNRRPLAPLPSVVLQVPSESLSTAATADATVHNRILQFDAQALLRYGPGTVPASRSPELFALEFRDPLKVPTQYGGIVRVQSRVFLGGAETAGVRIMPAPGAAPLTVGVGTLYRLGRDDTLTQLGRVSLHDDGVAPDSVRGDGSFGGAVVPPKASESAYPMRLALRVPVEQSGSSTSIEFLFEYTGQSPAEILSVGDARVENGSLAFRLMVDVRSPGQYDWLGRIVNASGTGIALLKATGQLQSGRQEVQLLAYGLFLRELGSVAGLSLRDIEGWRELTGSAIPKEVVPPWRDSYPIPNIEFGKLTNDPWRPVPLGPLIPAASAIRIPTSQNP
jgi:hypothetical protein